MPPCCEDNGHLMGYYPLGYYSQKRKHDKLTEIGRDRKGESESIGVIVREVL